MSLPPPPVPKFELGDCIITAHTLDVLTYEEIVQALQRHQGGDWGEVDEFERLSNEVALKFGLTLVSIYPSAAGPKCYVTTECNRCLTTVKVPEEY